jgi:hypothetical protein
MDIRSLWDVDFIEDTVSLTPTGRPQKVKRVWFTTIFGDKLYVDFPERAFFSENVEATINDYVENIMKIRGYVREAKK